MLRIADLTLPSKVCLAPMAGVTDQVYRIICRRFSAGLVYTEFVSANGVIRENERTLEMVEFREEERPIGVQIFGEHPGILAESAATLEETIGPDLIDLNFGCPVPKITRKGAGSAVLKDRDKVREICEQVVNSVEIPVTVKMRSGWSADDIIAVDHAQLIESTGVSALTLHGRTTDMGYETPSDWEIIGATKAAVSIPVIGNGDIRTPEDAAAMLRQTGCDGVMVARGALGNPWLLHRIHHYLETGELLRKPTYEERLELCLEHLQLMEQKGDPSLAANLMKKHIGWYLKGLPHATVIREAIYTSNSVEDMRGHLYGYTSRQGWELNTPSRTALLFSSGER